MPAVKLGEPHQRRARSIKVKTGCRTCKARKIKCDESRPACLRCSSSGRACDGYGIWGGGSGSHWRVEAGKSISRHVPTAFGMMAPEDVACFEWFTIKTATKLPGTYASGFWHTLLPQACLSEPIVRHAVLSLGSIHKHGVVDDQGSGTQLENLAWGGSESPALRNYLKALSELRNGLKPDDQASVRIALVACVVFVCLEAFRGHFQSALMHLQSGSRMWTEWSACRQLTRDPADDWIKETLSRLHMQVMLITQTASLDFECPAASSNLNTRIGFRSLIEAWQSLEAVVETCLRTSFLSQEALSRDDIPSRIPDLVERQVRVREELACWTRARQAFAQNVATRTEDGQAKLIETYQTMTTIMNETCLQPEDEMAFDSQDALFSKLVHQLTELWVLAARTACPARVLPGWRIDLASSVSDSGWLAPLWFAATRCRQHRLRRHALRLLEASSHREGLLDSKATACAARKVVEVEEGDFYKEFGRDDDVERWALGETAHLQDGMVFPTLPSTRRLQRVGFTLCGSPMERIELSGVKRSGKMGQRTLLASYDLGTQCWTDY